MFLALGGFDQQFGRGYYEDTDLGRRLIAQGWHLGVHPDCYLHHEGGASFGRGKEYRVLVARNRALYFSRYPDAQRNILMISARHTLDNLSSELKDNLDKVMQQGGSVYWVTSSPLTQLSCLQMHTIALKLTEVIRLMLKGRSRLDKRISAFLDTTRSIFNLANITDWMGAIKPFGSQKLAWLNTISDWLSR